METEYVKQMTKLMSMPLDNEYNEFATHAYEGVHLHLNVLRSTMEDLKTLSIRQDDVFVASFIKSGTTWTQEIASAALHDGKLEKLNQVHTFIRVPYLEMTFGKDKDISPRAHKLIELLPTTFPRLIKSHLPAHLLPPQVWEKKIKIVYVIRNPKDTLTSYYHFGKMVSPGQTFNFDDIFERFMKGELPCGNWWDHTLRYWQKRNEDHVLVLRFEDMKKDLRGTVKRVSEFLGKSFSDEILDTITDHCSFESMKKNPMTNPDTVIECMLGGPLQDGVSFLRKGNVGDWKTKLSPTQSEAIDEMTRKRLSGTGLEFEVE